MALKNRLERVEDAAAKADFEHKVAFITYDLAEKPKAEAIAEWEAENGPIAGSSRDEGKPDEPVYIFPLHASPGPRKHNERLNSGGILLRCNQII